MFREPIGEYKVGMSKYDTGAIGDEAHIRRVPMTMFYPEDKFGGECPVVICNHGLSGNEMESSVLCSDIASSGYVVASLGHPYGASSVTYTDGTEFKDPEPFSKMRFRLDEIEPLWYEDITAAIDLLKSMNRDDPIWKGRLRLDGIGTIGVSFGGCCSVTAALKNEEIKYAVNLDGSMFVEPEYRYPDTPILVMCSPFNIKAHRCLENKTTDLEVVKVKKVSHFEFSDGIYLTDKGKNNLEWADRISKNRAAKILEFISKHIDSAR